MKDLLSNLYSCYIFIINMTDPCESCHFNHDIFKILMLSPTGTLCYKKLVRDNKYTDL